MLTIGQLDIPALTKPCADVAQLSFDLFERVCGKVIRLCSQVTTSTGEIAAGHHANSCAAPGILPSEELVRSAQVFWEPLPGNLQKLPGFTGHRGADDTSQCA